MLYYNNIVHFLWLDAPFGDLEYNCINSWVKNNYECWVWSYDCLNLPHGAIAKKAADILPESSIFKHKFGKTGIGSVSGFSNFFRYKVLLEFGGVWSDADVYCFKRLPETPYLFIKESPYINKQGVPGICRVVSCIFAVPPNSLVMQECWDRCCEFDTDKLLWATSGPILLYDSILKLDLSCYIRSPEQYIPIMWDKAEQLMHKPLLKFDDCYTVHFWHQQLLELGYDLNENYDGSTFGALINNKILI